MPRIRTIKPEFFSHETLASKSPHARLLAIGLLTLADCKGRLRWVPMQVHSQVFPWEASVKIEVLLGELIECDYVVHYENDGKQYVEICNFTKHQRLSGKEASFDSRIPPIDDKSSKILGKTWGKKSEKPDALQGSSEKPLGTGEQGNRGTGEHIPKIHGEAPRMQKTYTDDFETFWNAYPNQRRTKKRDCFNRWKQALKQTTAEVLIAKAKAYAVSDVGRSEFAVMPSVWLNAGMWEDDEAAWSRGGTNTGGKTKGELEWEQIMGGD